MDNQGLIFSQLDFIMGLGWSVVSKKGNHNGMLHNSSEGISVHEPSSGSVMLISRVQNFTYG
jgi:hypothetical protein